MLNKYFIVLVRCLFDIYVGVYCGYDICKLLFCSVYRGYFNDIWFFFWVSIVRFYCV